MRAKALKGKLSTFSYVTKVRSFTALTTLSLSTESELLEASVAAYA